MSVKDGTHRNSWVDTKTWTTIRFEIFQRQNKAIYSDTKQRLILSVVNFFL